jgi:DNA modification methylase
VLACGDAMDADLIDSLVVPVRPAMAITDPPYNVNYDGKAGSRRKIANDAMDPAEWEEFARGVAKSLARVVDGALYVFMSCKEWPTIARILEEEGCHWSTTIIWAKDRFTLGRSDYQREFEPAWYGWPKGRKHHWCGDRDQGDVWRFQRPAASKLHPTQKPLELFERAIENSSKKGDVVLDLFTGSGTALVACERTGRVFRGTEIDPRYVDAAVARWEAFTGLEAVKA